MIITECFPVLKRQIVVVKRLCYHNMIAAIQTVAVADQEHLAKMNGQGCFLTLCSNLL